MIKEIPVDQNYDKKTVGFLSISKKTPLTHDSILVPETTDDGKLLGFSIIDRDRLITKTAREKLYGRKNWKELLK